MISELNGRITQKQIDDVVKQIKNQYHKYLNYINTSITNGIFAEEYAPTKDKHCSSWAISSAFPSGTMISGLNVRCKKYGLFRLARPELYNNNVIFHILANTVDLNANYLHNYYKMNSDLNNEVIYFYLYYTIKNDNITIEVRLPDENGEVIKSEVLYNGQTNI